MARGRRQGRWPQLGECVTADAISLEEDASLRQRLGVREIHRPYGATPVTSAGAVYAPRSDGTGLRMSIGSATAGALSLYYIANDYAAEISVDDDVPLAYCLSLVRSGHLHVRLPEGGTTVTGSPTMGVITHNRPGMKLLTSHGNVRLNLWVEGAALAAALRKLLDDEIGGPVVFQPSLDWQSSQGQSIRRLVDLCGAEIGRTDGLLSRPANRGAFEELIALALLQGLDNNYTHLLAPERHAPAPRHLRRAEAFMRENAGRNLSLGDIAAAAGCSIRSLQLAFRQWRDTTPMAMLRDLRLDAARTALTSGEHLGSVAEIARAQGFTHLGRFAASYRQRFGEYPSETQRGRGRR